MWLPCPFLITPGNYTFYPSFSFLIGVQADFARKPGTHKGSMGGGRTGQLFPTVL